jgi:hypothetical protein
MTASEPPNRECEAAPCTVVLERLDGVLRTARFKPAGAAGKGAQKELVSANDEKRNPGG